MADTQNIKNGPERVLTHVVGHDSTGKGGRQTISGMLNFGQVGGAVGPVVSQGKVVYGNNESGQYTLVAYDEDPSAFALVMRGFDEYFTVKDPTAAQHPASMGWTQAQIAAIPPNRDTGEAASQAAMLALDVTAPAECVRTDFDPPHLFFLHADPPTDIANWKDMGAFSGGAANPSATVGLAAKNGSAGTYMRSDAAPALDQGIAPTWTGKHIFSGPSTATEPGFQIHSALPSVDFYDTAGVNNTHRFTLLYDGNRQRVFGKLLNDDGSDLMTLWESDGGVFVVNPLFVADGETTAEQGTITAWANAPRIEINKANAATDAARWGLDGGTANTLTLSAISDDGATVHDIISLTRTGATITGIASNGGSGGWLHTGPFGSIDPGPLPGLPGSSGAYLYAGNGFESLMLQRAGNSAGNRRAFVGFESTGLSIGFFNDQSGTQTNVISAQGGAAVGITGVTSSSGTGTWAHTGAFSMTGAFSVGETPSAGTAGQVLTSAGAGASPTWGSKGNFGAPVSHTASGDINVDPSSPMVHLVDSTSGDVFMRLTDAPAGTVKIIKRMDNSASGVHITPQLGQSGLIDGVSDIGMSDQYSHRMIISNGPSTNTNWSIIGANGA